jgi:serine/threonine protein kinase
VAESGPFPSSGSYQPPDAPGLASSDIQLAGESSEDVIVPVHESSDDLVVPDDDLQLRIPDDSNELEIPDDDDDDDAVFAEPTVVLQDDGGESNEPTEVLVDGEDADDAVFAEPTVVLQDDAPAELSIPANALSLGDEDALLAEPTVVLEDGAQPIPTPAGDEDGIFAEPTVVISDSEAPDPELELPSDGDDGIYAEPTMVLSEDPAQTATAGARKSKSPSSHELEIDVSLAASSRRHSPSQLTPGVRSKKGTGPLDREEFERRLKRRMDFNGFSLGDYKILGELARGAFGVVLEVEPGGVAKSMARERGYQGNLALKVMMTNTSDPRQSDRFLEEVRVLISFDHPHIVRIFDAGVESGLTYYSMELVHGVETKAHVMENGPMPALLAVRVVKEIASALSYVHAQQIYHRDLKPQNVMLDTSYQPYRSLLIDFGLVTEAESNKDSGLIMGTPSYMPPEQAQPRGNHGPINSTSDIYSLGATMFYLLCGRAPFVGRDPRKIIKEVVNDPPPDPCELNPNIPRRIGDIVLKCLAKKQRDRYHSSRQLEAELDKELRSGRMKLKAKAILGRWLGRKK